MGTSRVLGGSGGQNDPCAGARESPSGAFGCHREGTSCLSARGRDSTRGSRALNSTLKTLFLWMAIFVVVILLWNAFQHSKGSQEDLKFSQFMKDLRAGKVTEVKLTGQQDLSGKTRDGREFKVTL